MGSSLHLHGIVLFSCVIYAAGVLDIDRCESETVCYYNEACKGNSRDKLALFDDTSNIFYSNKCPLIIQIKPFKANKLLIYMRVEGDDLNVSQGLNLYQAETLIVGCSGNGLQQHSDIETEWWNPDQPIFNSTMIFCAFTASTNKTDFNSFDKIGGTSSTSNIRYTVKGTEKKIESRNGLWTLNKDKYLRCNPEDVVFNDTHNPDEYFVYPLLDSSGAKIDCSGSNGSILVVYNETGNTDWDSDDTWSMEETSEITCNADYEFEYPTDTLGNKTIIPKGEILNAFCGVKVCTQCTRIPPPAQVGQNYLPVEITPGNDTSCASLTCRKGRFVYNKKYFLDTELDPAAFPPTCGKSERGVTWKVGNVVVKNISCFYELDCNVIKPLRFECPFNEDQDLCVKSHNSTTYLKIECINRDEKLWYRNPNDHESHRIDPFECNLQGKWTNTEYLERDAQIYCIRPAKWTPWVTTTKGPDLELIFWSSAFSIVALCIIIPLATYFIRKKIRKFRNRGAVVVPLDNSNSPSDGASVVAPSDVSTSSQVSTGGASVDKITTKIPAEVKLTEKELVDMGEKWKKMTNRQRYDFLEAIVWQLGRDRASIVIFVYLFQTLFETIETRFLHDLFLFGMMVLQRTAKKNTRTIMQDAFINNIRAKMEKNMCTLTYEPRDNDTKADASLRAASMHFISLFNPLPEQDMGFSSLYEKFKLGDSAARRATIVNQVRRNRLTTDYLLKEILACPPPPEKIDDNKLIDDDIMATKRCDLLFAMGCALPTEFERMFFKAGLKPIDLYSYFRGALECNPDDLPYMGEIILFYYVNRERIAAVMGRESWPFQEIDRMMCMIVSSRIYLEFLVNARISKSSEKHKELELRCKKWVESFKSSHDLLDFTKTPPKFGKP